MRQARLILFLLGISGSGKSYLAEYLARRHNWCHVDADRLDGDPMKKLGLEREWAQYFYDLDPRSLVDALYTRAAEAAKKHVVISFAGNLIAWMTPARIGALRWPIMPVILTGDARYCRAAFVRRELETGRKLDERHWHLNNDGLFENLHESHLKRYVLQVFRRDGTFVTIDRVYNQVMSRFKILECEQKR